MILRPVCLLFFAVASVAHASSGEVLITATTINVEGTEHNRTLECKGRKVSVSGVDNVLQLSGTCASIKISGSSNRVEATVVAGGFIRVVGTDNDVVWRSPGKISRAVEGVDNRVVQAR